MKKIFLIFSIIFSYSNLCAQLPNCPDTVVYYLNSPFIYKYNPALPISATNPSTYIPCNGVGLTLCNNLNAVGPSPTFYTQIGGIYNWWNGSTWINTGFNSGNGSAVNPGGGGCYIFNFVGTTGDVYRYDGTANGTLLTTIAGFATGGPYDLAADINGDFYVLKTNTPQSLQMYDFGGNPLFAYTMTGMPNAIAGAGFAVMGYNVFVLNSFGFYKGIVSGSVVNFTLIAPPAAFPGASDMGNCPSINTGIYNYVFTNNGPLGCGTNTVNVSAIGWAATTTYSWSGPGILGSTTSSTAVVFAPGTYSCAVTTPGACTSILTTSVGMCTGIMKEAILAEKELIFQPNPSNGEFTIMAKNDLNLKIINELGQTVFTFELNSNNNRQQIISDLANGIYFISDAQSGKLFKEKIVVVK